MRVSKCRAPYVGAGRYRFFALDEAFVGIDERYKPGLFGLAVKFDLDLSMTGHDLWVTTATVPMIAHYDLFHGKVIRTTSAMLLWDGRQLSFLYTRAARSAPAGAAMPPGAGGAAGAGAERVPRVYAGRLSRGILAEAAFLPQSNPATFICGPSGFVEAASGLLVSAGYAPGTIKTERFGPTS